MNRQLKDRATEYKLYRRTLPADFDMLELHEAYDNDISVVERCKEWQKTLWNLSYTILDKSGKPLAILGAWFMYSKQLELWAVVDKRVEQMPLYYSRATKFLVQFEFERLHIERMQVIIRADMPWAIKWAKMLGFEPEAVMRKYGESSEDHFLFSKVR